MAAATVAAALVAASLASAPASRAGQTGGGNRRGPSAGPAPSAELLPEPLPSGAIARFGSARLHHGTYVKCLTFSPDYRLLASAGGHYSQPGGISLWDVATGRLVRTLTGSPNGVGAVAFSPDGRMLVSAGLDRVLRFWDVKTGKPAARLNSTGARANWVSFSADGHTVGVSDGSKVHLIDTRVGKVVRSLGEGNYCVFSTDGKQVVTTKMHNTSGGPRLWEAATGKLLKQMTSRDRRLTVPAISPDGRWIAAGCGHGTDRGSVVIWEAQTGKLSKKLAGPASYIYWVAFSPDGKHLAATSQGGLAVWDVAKGKTIKQLSIGGGQVYTLAYSPGGRLLAAGGSDGQIRVWSTSDFKPLYTDLGHQGALRAVAAGRDGRGVLTIGSDNTARLWDGRSGKMLHRFGTAERPVAAASISPDGRTVALGDRDGIVRLADARTGRARREVKVDGGMKRGVAFLPGGKKLIAVGEAFTITTVDVATGKIDRVSRTARADVTRVSVSGDYRVAASADRQLAYAWELHTGKPLGAFGAKGIPSIYATAIDAYGRLLAADAGQKVVVFELDSGRVVRELPFAGRRTGGTTIDFSPDGAVLAVPDRSGVIEFRSVFTGAELGRRAGHRGLVVAMRFLPDGRRMLTGSADSTAILWDLARLKPARTPTGGRFDTKRLERLWEELSSADAAAAQKAIGELADGGDESVKLFARVLRPAEDPSTGQMQRLTADLDDPHFAVRRRATNELARMGAMAETTLRRVVADSASEEVRARAQELLEALDDPHRRTGAVIRQLRAVHALERIGTRAAIDLLGKLARGAEEANLTRRARAAVDRLRHR